jgi:two-component system, OmpR family, response regulator
VRILVVDDHLESASSLGEVLRLWGHEVHVVFDGTSALEAAGALQPRAVLLDIGLPGMNGYEVARLLRRLPPLQDALIVALTGYGELDDERLSQEAGFDRHCTKPVDLRELRLILAGADA